MNIEPEAPNHHSSVRRLFVAAFPSSAEANLVDQLHRDGDATISLLATEGLKRDKAHGWEAIFVVGDPAYYQRFGFRADEAAAFASPYAGLYLMD